MKDNKKLTYLLRDIPPALWRRAKHAAVEEDLTLRELLLKALDEHCHDKLKVREGGAPAT